MDEDKRRVLQPIRTKSTKGTLALGQGSAKSQTAKEIVSVDENGTVVEVLIEDAPLPHSAGQGSAAGPGAALPGQVKTEALGWHWPFHRKPTPTPSKPKTVEKRMWVPSTEKLSLQVMWWGYRL